MVSLVVKVMTKCLISGDVAVEGTAGSSPPAMTAFVGIPAQAPRPTGPSEGYEFVVSEAAAAKGCVLLTANKYLNDARMKRLDVVELRDSMVHVRREHTEAQFQDLIGKDSLGNMTEDEALVPQLHHALQAKFGRLIIFKKTSSRALLRGAKPLPRGARLLMQVGLQRAPIGTGKKNDPTLSNEDNDDTAVKNAAGLWVTESHQTADEHDPDWLHVLLMNPETDRFWCANLNSWESTHHLDLDKYGRTNGGGYVKTIERVYTLMVKVAPRKRRRTTRATNGAAKKQSS